MKVTKAEKDAGWGILCCLGVIVAVLPFLTVHETILYGFITLEAGLLVIAGVYNIVFEVGKESPLTGGILDRKSGNN
jgi:hypothetical protein